MSESLVVPALQPLAYHLALCEELKHEDREVWDWFSAHRVRGEQADQVRFDLLKTTYRIDPDSQPALYRAAHEVAAQLGLEIPITIYQAQHAAGTNASIAYLLDEAHLVFSGPLTSQLSATELRALIGHELSHLLLWRLADGEFLLADQVLDAFCNDPSVQPAHVASARLWRLYTEIFCDRGAWTCVRDLAALVGTLIKVETGLSEVSAESYLRQAEEIFAKGAAWAEGITHPETFIRARAARLWAEADPNADLLISEMIEGPSSLDSLDLLGRRRVADWTRQLLETLLQPSWFQTEPVLAHARLFFDDFQPRSASSEPRDPPNWPLRDAGLRDYCCFLLLDFATADRELEDVPLARALEIAERLDCKPRLLELARKELRLRKGQLDKIDLTRDELLSRAASRGDGG